MKEIAIVTYKMVSGGVEKALLNMLQELIDNKYKVTLMLLSDGGLLKEAIPAEVKVIPIMQEDEIIDISKEEIFADLKNLRLLNGLNKLSISLLFKTFKNPSFLFKFQCYKIKPNKQLGNDYDFAIAYHAPVSLAVFYTLFHVKAKNKILWIHGDVTKSPFDIKKFSNIYKKYDSIFCVSKLAREKLVEKLPELDHKADVLYNLVDQDDILKKASEESIDLNRDCEISLVTVGRISYEKGYDLAINTCARLVEEGFDVKWYICGEGETEEYDRLIAEKGLEGRFIFLGNINNPYPYIKAADIYVQTSIHEGYCLALHEARVLNKPIVTTDFLTAKEQIINGETGIIVPINDQALSQAISGLILDGKQREKLQYNLSQNRSLSENQMQKLYKKLDNG